MCSPDTEMGYKAASSAFAKNTDVGNVGAFASDAMDKSFYDAGRSKIGRGLPELRD